MALCGPHILNPNRAFFSKRGGDLKQRYSRSKKVINPGGIARAGSTANRFGGSHTAVCKGPLHFRAIHSMWGEQNGAVAGLFVTLLVETGVDTFWGPLSSKDRGEYVVAIGRKAVLFQSTADGKNLLFSDYLATSANRLLIFQVTLPCYSRKDFPRKPLAASLAKCYTMGSAV